MALPRGLQIKLSKARQTDPVVILEGARLTGKTTLAQSLIEQGIYNEYRSLADQVDYSAANYSPEDYIHSLPFGTIIDEAQLVEDLTLPIKKLIDADPTPGRFLLTGSARLHRSSLGGSDPLAGRAMPPFRLYPFSQAEKAGKPTTIVDQLTIGDPTGLTIPEYTRNDLAHFFVKGGMPGFPPDLSRLQQHQRSVQYIQTVVNLPTFKGRDVTTIESFYRFLCASTSELVNVNRFAQGKSINRKTVGDYLDLLEETMLIEQIPGWRSNQAKTEMQRPKLHICDTGLASSLAGLDPVDSFEDFGRLAETFVANELKTQSSWSETEPRLYHWRHRQRSEIDLLLVDSLSNIVCVEVKSKREVNQQDFRHIDSFEAAYPKQYSRGYVFYTGNKVVPFGKHKWAIPITALLH